MKKTGGRKSRWTVPLSTVDTRQPKLAIVWKFLIGTRHLRVHNMIIEAKYS